MFTKTFSGFARKTKQYAGLSLRTLLASSICLSPIVAGAQQSASHASTAQSGRVQGRLIIKFRQGYRPFTAQGSATQLHIRQVDELNTRFGCTSAKRMPTGKAGTSYVYILEFPASTNLDEVLQAYRATGVLEAVEPDSYTSTNTTTPNDPYFNTDWASYNPGGTFGIAGVAGADMEMRNAWDITTGSSGITMAIIDAGVKLDHPEFSGRIWTNTGEIAANGIDDDGNGYIDDYRGWDWVNNDNNPSDDNGHGTHVAGIAAAKGNNSIGHAGIDWNCKIMALKTQSATGGGYMSNVATAIYYATDEGAKVINMSLGSATYSTIIQDAVDYAYAHNVVCVAAMGNSNTITPAYPAGCNHVIAVGASTCADTRASFSNYGSHISVMAPGYYITGLSYNNDFNYSVIMYGTSMASPQVAGVVSLMLAVDPSKTPDDIKNILELTAEDQVGTPAEDTPGFDIYYGHGRVNAYHALQYLTSQISGASSVCVGSSISLTSATAGGTWTSSTPSVATISSAGVVAGVSAGTTSITYTYPGGSAVRVISVLGAPAVVSISGATSVCQGSTTLLTPTLTGGTWTSTNTAVATVSTIGTISGISPGTALISYAYSNGCGTSVATRVMTIDAAPSAGVISGASSVAFGSTITLSSTVPGGTWTSGTVRTSVSSAGVVTGLAVGTSVISYSLPNACGTAVATYPLTITPGTLTGSTSICTGATSTLSWGIAGGTWTSSAAGIASVSAAGVILGGTPGTATISYTLAGAANTAVVTVNTLPAAITGTLAICTGSSATLANTLTGGTWSSSAPAVATIASASGVATGVATGNAIITYTSAAGCIKTAVATINATPVVSGAPFVCPTKTTALTSSPASISWASSSTAVATVLGGTVTGIAAGTAVITFTTAAGCKAMPVVSVHALPSVIAGSLAVCVSSSTSLSNTVTGGTWVSSTPTIASIGTSGIVSGLAAGNATISYTSPDGCLRTGVLTVNALPVISGTPSVCVGTTAALASASIGGTWASLVTGTATVSTTGVVTGIGAGTASIVYTLANGCKNSAIATVNVTPGAIGGTASVCAGSATTLTNAVTGGTWSSAAATITIGSATGVVTGITAGTALVSYTKGQCRATTIVTVMALPNTFTGTFTACTGSTTTLANTSAGGTWTSGSTAIATVGSTGIVSGVAAGTANITYTTANTCRRIATVTVNNSPAAIAGAASVCAGSTTTLTNPTTGLLSWTSSDATKATITSAGVVSGVAAGTARITYTISSGCYSTKVLTINALPAAITGTLTACPGTTATLGNTTTGGTWASGATGTATIGSATGIFTGVAAGTATITYTSTLGCKKTTVVTVNANPVVSGTLAVCAGKTTALTSVPAASAWASGSTAIATVAMGVVTGVAGGTTIITFTTAAGCKALPVVTVNALPPVLSGTMTVCAGSSTSLTNSVTGGTWASSAVAVGTVGTSGVVAGIAAGTTTISYTAPTGCLRTGVITVNALPTVTGTVNVCVGTAATFTGMAAGGTWTSLNTAVATVSAAGLVTGVAAGTTAIDYTLANGCKNMAAATVNVTPVAIGGAASVCAGSTTVLSNPTSGGTWTSSMPTIATVGTSGILTGVAAGTTLVSYTIGSCRATRIATVMALPALIAGTTKACPGTTTALTNTTTGGTWASSDAAIATAGSTGIITGVAPGTVTIVYTATNTCSRSVIVTINSNPTAILGSSGVCVGATVSLSVATSASTLWTSSDATRATVNTSGIVTGVAAGTARITYTLATGCYTTKDLTINALPAGITGTLLACAGNSTALSNTSAGGAWTSGNTAIATVGTSGVVTGVAGGTAVITYTLPTGCFKAATATINASPAPLTGSGSVCTAATTTLGATGTGVWSSLAPAIATVNAAGIVTGVTPGTTTINFAFANGCKTSVVVTVSVCGPKENPLAVTATPATLSVSCYPNPTTGSFVITSTASGALQLFTADGRLAASFSITAPATPLQLPADIASGTYLLRFTATDGAVSVSRLVVALQ